MIFHDSKRGWILPGRELRDFFGQKTMKVIADADAPKYKNISVDDYQTYYFDSILGYDGNDGLSPENAKQTLTEASRIAELHGAEGIRLLFKAGAGFVGNLILRGFEAKESRPVVIDKYPAGSTDLPKLTGDGDVVRIMVGNVRVNNLEVTGPTAYRGIYCVPEKCGALKNVVIQGCYVHDINFNWIYDKLPKDTRPDDIDLEVVCPEYKADKTTYDRYHYRYYGGIILLNDTRENVGASWFENVWVVGNRVECVARTGITMFSRWSNKGGVGYGFNKTVDDTPDYNDPPRGIGCYRHKNVVFKGNYVDCAGGDGIVLSSVDNCFLEGNIAYRSNYLGRKNYWNGGAWVYDVHHCYYQYNEVAYTYMRNNSNDAEGLDLDNCCTDVYVQYNYCHHNEGGGLLMCNLETPIYLYDANGEHLHRDEKGDPVKTKVMGKWYNNFIYSNVFAYNGNRSDPTRSAFITIAREVDHVFAWNNTVIMDPGIKGQSIINTEDESTKCYNHVYAQNIFYAPGKTDSVLTIKMMSDVIFDNNLFFNMGQGALETAADQNVILDEPRFAELEARDGYDNIQAFRIINTALHEKGRVYAVKTSKDAAGNTVEGKKFIGAFSE